MIGALKVVAVLLAAVILGNWYQSESKRLRALSSPWYAVYLSPPGLIILLCLLLLPILLWFFRQGGG